MVSGESLALKGELKKKNIKTYLLWVQGIETGTRDRKGRVVRWLEAEGRDERKKSRKTVVGCEGV